MNGINFNFDPSKDPDSFSKLVKVIEQQMPDQLKLYVLIAKMTRVKYEAMLKEGFTSEQALELSKKI